jgi:acyl dehydratase
VNAVWPFTSGTHALDERQITAFASEFDPQPFHIDREVTFRVQPCALCKAFNAPSQEAT